MLYCISIVEYSIQSLTAALRAARKEKALSQRALSSRIGMPQSRLSKIENGAVDLRTSTLLELARALDLEPVLVPRQLVPAVNSIIAQTGEPTAGEETSRPVYRLPAAADDDG